MKVICLLLILSSCSLSLTGKDVPKSAKDSHYSIEYTLPGWEHKKDKRSDYVFNNKDGRILLSNSFCEEFQEQPLDRLALKTFNNITNFKETTGRFTAFNDREAYRLEGIGQVDGVKVNLRLLNTRRNNCYFDFLSISPDGSKDEENAFENFLNAVEFK
jgi:hypothetical protein